MYKKTREILSIALLPFIDILFGEENFFSEFKEIKSKSLKNRRKLDLMYRVSEISNINNLDLVELTLKKYFPFWNKSDYKDDDILKCYYNILGNFSRSLITHRNGRISYKYWESEIDNKFIGPYNSYNKIEIFRNINLLMSIDLLSIIHLIENSITDCRELNYFYSDVNLADSQLDDLLISGVAENHVHANAGFKFIYIWEDIMNERSDEKILNKINFCENRSDIFKKHHNKYFKLAIIYRTVLALYIKNSDCFYNSKKKNESIFENFIDSIKIDFSNIINKCIDQITIDQLNTTLEAINKKVPIIDLDENIDIIFRIFDDCKAIKTYGENIFLFKVILKYKQEQDAFFFKVFLKYIRIKNEFYQQVVQSNLIKGLDNFSKIFGIGRDLIHSNKSSNRRFYEVLLRTIFQDEYLRRVELRLGIVQNLDKLKNNFVDLMYAYKKVIDNQYRTNENPNVEFPRLGVVYDLLKIKDYNILKKCWVNANSEEKRESLYYGEIQFKYRQCIENLINLRKMNAYSSYFILGLDAASLENNTPVQVFSPIYEYARNSSKEGLMVIDKNGNHIKYKSLGFTFHAGEEFRHILSGIRRISEVITHCKFRSGDRIGHAIALGVNTKKWIKDNPILIIPRGEHLDNLLWVWGIYSKYISDNIAINIFLEKEIYNLAKEIFVNMNGITIPMLYEAYKERFNEFQINNKYINRCGEEKKNYIDQPLCIKMDNGVHIWNSNKITHAYHCSCYLKLIEEPIYVQSNEIYKEIIDKVQSEVINELACRGIVVEINPSSNASIGEISSILENQAFCLNKFNSDNFNNVMININTDDPMIFNTNISNEYAYIYYGLLNKGIGKEKVLEWIEKLRKTGMDTSFIENKLSNRQYYEYLCNLLDEFNAE